MNYLPLRALPIESVAERLGLKIEKHKCLCPYHNDSHPSLSFHQRTNTFRCFACGAHGGVIDLAMQVLGKNFVETCNWLIEDNGLRTTDNGRGRDGSLTSNLSSLTSNLSSLTSNLSSLTSFDASRYAKFFEHPFLNLPAQRFLYQERHLDPRVIRWCRLSSYTDRHGTPWLQIPYYDQDYHLIGIQNRNLSPSSPRFRFPTGSQCHIYNLPVLRLLRPHEPLFITEGCSDCWAMLSSGHKAIAIPSATLLNPQDLQLLSTLTSNLSTQFHIYPDQDLPGERLYQQLSTLLPNLTRHQLPPGHKDFSEFYASLR